MDEATWLASDDPAVMLVWLRHLGMPGDPNRPFSSKTPKDRLWFHSSDRKLRLFACACCRSEWHLLTDDRSRRAVEVAERFADGEATEEECLYAGAHAGLVPRSNDNRSAVVMAAAVCQLTADPAGCAGQVIGWSNPLRQHAIQANLLRDIFGNPYRPWCTEKDRRWADRDSVEADEWVTRTCGDRVVRDSWLTWNDGTVPKLARVIYDERRFEDMPILADALEEAGCSEEFLLSHLRGLELVPDEELPNKYHWARMRGPHVRGCWVLDLLLGRN